MRLAGIDVDAAPELILPILLAALVVLAGLAARLARGATSRWLSGEPVSIPVACAVVIGGLLSIPDIGLPGRLGRWLEGTLNIGFVLACALVVSHVAVAAVTEYATRNPSMSPAVGVARVSVRLLVGALAIITAFETLGVPVAPLLTTLGVGSLAVALALQETLANFFAAFTCWPTALCGRATTSRSTTSGERGVRGIDRLAVVAATHTRQQHRHRSQPEAVAGDPHQLQPPDDARRNGGQRGRRLDG